MGPRFLEFFAGGGMARAGLGAAWRCQFANDFDAKKCAAYRVNWGVEELVEADVGTLRASDVPGPRANLAWASFPCQDLSLAGPRAGLGGGRSGAFFSFWSLIEALAAERRGPDIIVLENVQGTLSSHAGADFAALCARLDGALYRFGAMIVDAASFVPQSRPRLFILGVREGLHLPPDAIAAGPRQWHPKAVRDAQARLPPALRESFVWWRMPAPAPSALTLADILEEVVSTRWRSDAQTAALLAQMSERNLQKLERARAEMTGGRAIGCVYRRMRQDASGARRQRAEARFDGLSGCLRTPGGGSSRQFILVVERHRVRSRLMSAREIARLMGLADAYRLPESYHEACHLIGDGVAAPVVRHLAEHLLEPILAHQGEAAEAAE